MKRLFTFILTIMVMTLTVRGTEHPENTRAGEDNATWTMVITVDGTTTMTATMVSNSSTHALREKLEQGDVSYEAHDYGSFEKVGDLPFSLPQNNTDIVTEPGDVILYLGQSLCLYYDTNSWDFTRMGKIDGKSQGELKSILKAGGGNVRITLSLPQSSAVRSVKESSSQSVSETVYMLDGKPVARSLAKKGVYIDNGRKIVLWGLSDKARGGDACPEIMVSIGRLPKRVETAWVTHLDWTETYWNHIREKGEQSKKFHVRPKGENSKDLAPTPQGIEVKNSY